MQINRHKGGNLILFERKEKRGYNNYVVSFLLAENIAREMLNVAPKVLPGFRTMIWPVFKNEDIFLAPDPHEQKQAPPA